MAENLKGFRQTYQETGKLSSGGGPEAEAQWGRVTLLSLLPCVKEKKTQKKRKLK